MIKVTKYILYILIITGLISFYMVWANKSSNVLARWYDMVYVKRLEEILLK